MHRFTTEYPQINLDISVNVEAGDIVGNHFDAGIHPAESLAQDMIAVPNATWPAASWPRDVGKVSRA
jgi:hypothetical protein